MTLTLYTVIKYHVELGNRMHKVLVVDCKLFKLKHSIFAMENIFNNPAFAHILEEIFLNLKIEDLTKCRKVNRNFKAVLDQPTFWLKKNQIDGVIRKPHFKFWMILIQMVHDTELENNLNKALRAINAKENNTVEVDPMAELVKIDDLVLMKEALSFAPSKTGIFKWTDRPVHFV